MTTRHGARIQGVTELPAATPTMRVGLFGGSFNPPHQGHRLVALQALKRLRLDAVWLLVTPGNPLKNHDELAPLPDRVARARALMNHPQIRVTGFEAAHGFRYTYQTLEFLKSARPGTRFVWIMGADNLRDFHHWERWREIAGLMPIAVYVRPGSSRLAPVSRAAQALKAYRVDEADAARLADCRPPAWVYLHGLMSGLSSTLIRTAPGREEEK